MVLVLLLLFFPLFGISEEVQLYIFIMEQSPIYPSHFSYMLCLLIDCLIILCLFGNAELSNVPGLVVASHVLSPIVFLKLKKSSGSDKTDMHLLELIAKRVSLLRI
jgi:hypothetical protein